LQDLLGAPGPARKLPLHAKPEAVGTLDLARLLALRMSDDVREKLNRALRWLKDPALYETVAARLALLPNPRVPRKSTLSKEDTEMLLAIHRYQVADDIKCGANVFTVIEAAKRRRRLIIEPLLNDVIYPTDFDSIALPRSEKIRKMANMPFFVQFDAKAFYDQIPLHEALRGYFGVGGGAVSCSLPMGFRPACSVAQRIAEALLDFDVGGRRWAILKEAYIDNFFFAGSCKETVHRAATIFLERCTQVGIVLNTTDIVFTESFDALGEHFETDAATRAAHGGNGTVSLTDTTIEKLRVAKAQLLRQDSDLLSFRQVAAIFGIAFYAARVSDRPPTFAFSALRFYRECIANCGAADWSHTAPRMYGRPRQELEGWLDVLLLNVPVTLGGETGGAPDCVIYSDASAWGWGCCVTREGRTTHESGEWSASERMKWDVHSSVAAEPLGIVHAVIAGMRSGDRKIAVYTDHLPLIFAWRRGYGKAWAYNEMVVTLRRLLGDVQVEMHFVAGVDNPADRWSRGFACSAEDDEIAFSECEGTSRG
jgi:hypothetical protein